MIRSRFAFCLLASLTSLLSGIGLTTLQAEVTRFEILSREPFAEGFSFGDVGPYERIVGRVHYALDPDLPQNKNVIDLKRALRNADGKVVFSGDLFILAPLDPSRGNGALLYDVNNRGNKLALRFFNEGGGGNNPQSKEHAGDGFLMRKGFTVVWSGWDGELLPGGDRLQLSVPLAEGDDANTPLTGLVRCEIVPGGDITRSVINWANHGSYRPTQSGIEKATLTHREYPSDPRVTIPREEWSLHVTEIDTSTGSSQLPQIELEVPKGMKRGHIYELIYEARDPLVHGVCFTSLRDLISSLKQGTGANNPLVRDGKSSIVRAHGFGVSQSGRFLREFLYSGFNEDEDSRLVFDGMIPHVAGGGLGSFNHRFAQPTRHANQHDHHDYPPDRFPFAYETQHDPISGRDDGILMRTPKQFQPRIMHTLSAAEYWTRSGSLTTTDPLGKTDAKLPENVRVYLFGGTQHGPSGFPPSQGIGQTLANPGDYKPFLRSLLLALDQWCQDEKTLPPPSVYPTIADGTLVDWKQKSTGFPEIPGVRYPEIIQQPSYLDFGPRWETERIIDQQPPIPRGDYRVLAPRCGPDGNELGTLLPPEVAVPIATHTGWNLRRKDVGAANDLVSLTGSYIPFPRTKKERYESGDPRPSLEERYGTRNEYLKQLTAACEGLVKEGYLMEEDVQRIVNRQKQRVAELFE